MTRKWMWARCALEAAFVLQYIFRVPFFVRVCQYKLNHESLSYNAQWFFGMALGLGTVVLAAWDCRRMWRRLKRMKSLELAE